MTRRTWCEVCVRYHRFSCPVPRMPRKSRKVATFVEPETLFQRLKRWWLVLLFQLVFISFIIWRYINGR
jgi:hypothetical protein